MRRDTIPSDMPTHNRPLNEGVSLNDNASRLDGPAKVTGAAKYSRDQLLPNSLFAGYVICPYGKATLESFDEAAAKGVPGVVEVRINDSREGRYHGHTLGYVLAESPLALKRGLRALNCRWKRDTPKTRIEDSELPALAPNDDSRQILKDAKHTIEAEYATQIQTHVCLETHGGCVDHKGDSAKAYISTQGVYAAIDGVDEAIGLPRGQYEVVCDYIGGGFGSKLNGSGKEGTLAARLAAKYKRPVWVFRDRKQDQVDTGNRPSALARVKMGFGEDGTPAGGVIQKFGGVGVGGGGGMSFPSGRYNLGNVQVSHTDVHFNGGAPRPARAPGHPQGSFIEEMMLEEMAVAAGVDPLDLRRRIDTSGTRKEMLELGAKLIGWHERRTTPDTGKVVRRGFGVAAASWHPGGDRSNCEVVIMRDGSVESRSGTQDIGSGQRTTMGIAASHGLGVPLSYVTSKVGSSNLPEGPGSGGSTTSPSTAPVMIAAAQDARKQLLESLAGSLGVAADALEIKDGQVLIPGKPAMAWKEACSKIAGDQIVGRASRGKRGEGNNDGVQFVYLEVDTETGNVFVNHVVAIQACGMVVFRKGAESQVIGGVIQGISYALYENQVLDRAYGSMLNANMEWYKILGPADMPHITPVLWNKGATGVRGIGEPPAVPTAAAVGCAVFNALGVPIRSLPMTPDKVLAAVAGGRK